VRPLVSSETPGYTGMLCIELAIDDVDARHPRATRSACSRAPPTLPTAQTERRPPGQLRGSMSSRRSRRGWPVHDCHDG
jgi:hypothetical protein